MWIDLTPLKRNRDYRYAYLGQFVSFLGTMLSRVAVPFQVYHLTNSTLAVGLLGIVELIPLLLTAFIGGALADVMDRRKLLIYSEMGMALCILILMLNALSTHPQLWLIYVIAAITFALTGLHRPSLDALLPRLVSFEEIAATSVLSMFRATVGMICGPAIAGICIAIFGLAFTYMLDVLTFVFSIVALMQIRSLKPPETQDRPSIKSVMDALHYAISRQELMGTYVVDFFAMVFAMPNPLYPAMAVMLGGAKTLGWLYAGPAIGALIVTVFSGWTSKITRQGAAVAISAICWGGAIACIGLCNHMLFIIFFLIFAGAADCVSGIFRTTIWNETIPDRLRGRMASLEMISYMSGPLLGTAQVGLVASLTSIPVAILSGGVLCVIAVCLSSILLPAFWTYNRKRIKVQN